MQEDWQVFCDIFVKKQGQKGVNLIQEKTQRVIILLSFYPFLDFQGCGRDIVKKLIYLYILNI